MAENQEPVKVEEQGPFIHQLQLFFPTLVQIPTFNL